MFVQTGGIIMEDKKQTSEEQADESIKLLLDKRKALLKKKLKESDDIKEEIKTMQKKIKDTEKGRSLCG